MLSESFEILLNNDTARSYINSIIQQVNKSTLPLSLSPVLTLTLEEIKKNGEEAGIYLDCLKQLVLSNRPSVRKPIMRIVKVISIGSSKKGNPTSVADNQRRL